MTAAGEVLVRLVLWNLADSKTTIGELRRYLRDESVDEAAETAGLRLRAWVSDESSERWGAVELWESREAAEAAPPTRTRDVIGRDPAVAEWFDVEATIEGRFAAAELSRLGLAFGSEPES